MSTGFCKPTVPLPAPAALSVVRIVYSRPNCTNAACPSRRWRTRSLWLPRADAPPLAIIRSLAYFSPVIEEVLALPPSPEYFRYLRQRIATRTSPQ
jgi:hypothetical protein